MRRGHAVLTRLLCGVLPDPPANVPPPQPPTPGLTTRQRFTEHDQNACTGGCHSAWIRSDSGSSTTTASGSSERPTEACRSTRAARSRSTAQTQTFPDALALAKMLAASPQVQTCFATQWMRYALNRWDTSADAGVDPGGDQRVPGGGPQHARSDRRGGDVAHLPLPGPRRRGGVAMKPPMKTENAKYSRRAILKAAGYRGRVSAPALDGAGRGARPPPDTRRGSSGSPGPTGFAPPTSIRPGRRDRCRRRCLPS